MTNKPSHIFVWWEKFRDWPLRYFHVLGQKHTMERTLPCLILGGRSENKIYFWVSGLCSNRCPHQICSWYSLKDIFALMSSCLFWRSPFAAFLLFTAPLHFSEPPCIIVFGKSSLVYDRSYCSPFVTEVKLEPSSPPVHIFREQNPIDARGAAVQKHEAHSSWRLSVPASVRLLSQLETRQLWIDCTSYLHVLFWRFTCPA